MQASGAEKGGLGQALIIRSAFLTDLGVCRQVLRRVLAAAGALFSLWRPVANTADFWLHFGWIWGVQKAQPTGDKIQDTRYRIQETAGSIHIQAYRSRGIRRCKYARIHGTQATGYRSKANSSQPDGPSKEGPADIRDDPMF